MLFDYFADTTKAESKSVDSRYQILKETMYKIIKKSIKQTEKMVDSFCPDLNQLELLPKFSVFFQFDFKLRNRYFSRDDSEIHISGNPIVRDRLTGLPVVKPTSWKGHLRFAGWRESKGAGNNNIFIRLFGNERGDEELLKGRLHFYPSFFKENCKSDNSLITPLGRKNRTPIKGKSPIKMDVVLPGSKSKFCLLYTPYPMGKKWSEKETIKDLEFLCKSLESMFLTYGFSAKKTSGFGITYDDVEKGLVKTRRREWKFSKLTELMGVLTNVQF